MSYFNISLLYSHEFKICYVCICRFYFSHLDVFKIHVSETYQKHFLFNIIDQHIKHISVLRGDRYMRQNKECLPDSLRLYLFIISMW